MKNKLEATLKKALEEFEDTPINKDSDLSSAVKDLSKYQAINLHQKIEGSNVVIRKVKSLVRKITIFDQRNLANQISNALNAHQDILVQLVENKDSSTPQISDLIDLSSLMKEFNESELEKISKFIDPTSTLQNLLAYATEDLTNSLFSSNPNWYCVNKKQFGTSMDLRIDDPIDFIENLISGSHSKIALFEGFTFLSWTQKINLIEKISKLLIKDQELYIFVNEQKNPILNNLTENDSKQTYSFIIEQFGFKASKQLELNNSILLKYIKK